MQTRAHATSIVARLQRHGHKAVFAGGCVRDQLMGVPAKDFDIATSATPEEVLDLFERTIEVGRAFGVVRVLLAGEDYEVATFREEDGYLDGRRPTALSWCAMREDALRRDLTINALFFDPVAERLYDYVGGQQDIADGRIRFVGRADDRLREDHLRILRALRFAAHLGFELVDDTAAALREHASLAASVSKERLFEELSRGLTCSRPDLYHELLHDYGVWTMACPEVAALDGRPRPGPLAAVPDARRHVTALLAGAPSPSLTLAWAITLHAVAAPSEEAGERAAEILRRFGSSRAIGEAVATLVGCRDDVAGLGPQSRRSQLLALLRRPTCLEELELLRLEGLAAGVQPGAHAFLTELQRTTPAEEIDPRPLVTGRDLIRSGVRPGPAMGRVLQQLRTEQLDGDLTTPEEALERAHELLDSDAAPA